MDALQIKQTLTAMAQEGADVPKLAGEALGQVAEFASETEKAFADLKKTLGAIDLDKCAPAEKVEALGTRMTEAADRLKALQDWKAQQEVEVNAMKAQINRMPDGSPRSSTDADKEEEQAVRFKRSRLAIVGQVFVPEVHKDQAIAEFREAEKASRAMFAPNWTDNAMTHKAGLFTSIVDPQGGYVVLPVIEQMVMDQMFRTTPALKHYGFQTVGGTRLEGATRAGRFNVVRRGRGAQGSIIQQVLSNTNYGAYSIPMDPAEVATILTQSQLNDPYIDQAAYVTEAMGRDLGNELAVQCVSGKISPTVTAGDGHNQPKALLAYATDSATPDPFTEVLRIATGSSSGITAAGARNIIFDVVEGYRVGAIWTASRTGLIQIMACKDGETPYWTFQTGVNQGWELRFGGYPVVEFDAMPAVGSGANAFTFGNHQEAYLIGVRAGMSMKRIEDTNTLPNTLFYGYQENGGGLRKGEAVRIGKCA